MHLNFSFLQEFHILQIRELGEGPLFPSPMVAGWIEGQGNCAFKTCADGSFVVASLPLFILKKYTLLPFTIWRHAQGGFPSNLEASI